MSEREQHMDTDKRTGTSGQCGNTDEMRWDLGTLFPAKGDPRRPPEWLGRALLYIAIAIVLLSFCWRSWGKIEYLIIDVVISLFLALAVEPVVIPLVKHGWKRSFASIFALLMLGVLLCVMFGLFGNLFVQQVIALCNGLPALYQQICDFVAQYTDFKLPEINSLGGEILKNIQTSWVTDFAGTAISTVSGFFSFLLNLMTVIMTTFLHFGGRPEAAPRGLPVDGSLRAAPVPVRLDRQPDADLIVPVLTCHPRRAQRVLHLDLPDGVARAVLDAVGVVLRRRIAVHPDARHVHRRRVAGAVRLGQLWFVAGDRRGGVHLRLPADRKLDLRCRKISRRTMDVNDAVAFLAVLAFGSLFGAIGAFLALPIVASIQTIARTYTKRYDLVDSPLMDDPVPDKKSKLVEGAEVLSEHLHNMPRAVQGSSAHVLFPTKCGSCRSRRTISLGPTRPGMPTNRRPSPFRSTCWTGSIASRCGEPRKRTERRRKPDRR